MILYLNVEMTEEKSQSLNCITHKPSTYTHTSHFFPLYFSYFPHSIPICNYFLPASFFLFLSIACTMNVIALHLFFSCVFKFFQHFWISASVLWPLKDLSWCKHLYLLLPSESPFLYVSMCNWTLHNTNYFFLSISYIPAL